MAKLEKTDVELMLYQLEAEMIDLINERCGIIHKSVSSEIKNKMMTVDRDYQRDTYEMVKEIKYSMKMDKLKQDLEKMEQEKKCLELKIEDTKMAMAHKESNYYNS